MKKDEYPGKRKCAVLKDIRRKIAESEGIKYAPAECHHEGDCPAPARVARQKCSISSAK